MGAEVRCAEALQLCQTQANITQLLIIVKKIELASENKVNALCETILTTHRVLREK